MMRWKVILVGLALTIAAVGCKQQIFLHEPDLKDNLNLLPLGPGEACNPNVLPPHSEMRAPPTIFDPDRPPRYMTLQEAIAIALERGTTGIESTRQIYLSLSTAGGTGVTVANDELANFAGNPTLVQGSDSIRVLAYEPAIVGTEIEGSLARFDAVWQTAVGFSTVDQPAQGFATFQSGQFADFTTQLAKPLPTGGLASILFGNSAATTGQHFYSFLTRTPTGVTTTNPAYTPDLRISVTQPLLQNFGEQINQLLPTHPFENQFYQRPFQTEGILITRLRFDQGRLQFEVNSAFLLANVETAYWNLYGAYFSLYARESALRQAYEAWKISKAKYDAGRIAVTDYAQTLGQYEDFRAQRIAGLGQVLEQERALRSLLGLPAEDGTRIVPVDTPTLAPINPDWTKALNETLALRPELVIARNDLKQRQLMVLREENALLPILNLNAGYNIHGLGNTLEGNGTTTDPATGITTPNNAFRSLASTHFTDYDVSLTFTMPLGYRNAHAALRQARLRLAQGLYQVRDQEDKAIRFLTLTYRQLFEAYATIQARRSQRLAAAAQVSARFREFVAGKTTADFLLEAQRQWAAALEQEFTSVARYNQAIALFEFSKGTLLQHDNVHISEGPLPKCVQVRAVEHERQRVKAIVLRERACPVPQQPCNPAKSCPGLPDVPLDHAPAVPSLLASEKDMLQPPAMMPQAPLAAMEQAGPLPQGPLTGIENLPPAPPASVPDQPLDRLPEPVGLGQPAPLKEGSDDEPVFRAAKKPVGQ